MEESGDPSTPLTGTKMNTSNVYPLYDADSTLEIGSNIAAGYLILLTGGKLGMDEKSKVGEASSKATLKNRSAICCGKSTESGQKNILQDKAADVRETDEDEKEEDTQENEQSEDESLKLAFMTLTEGNVIDACFGDHPQGGVKFAGSKYAVKAARRAKEILSEASESNEDIKRLAVDAYVQCFKVVIGYNDQIGKLGLITWCFRAQKLRANAEASLENSFEELNKALAEVS